MLKPLDARKTNSQEGGASFGLSNRVFRAIWRVTWIVAASWTHPLHGWRRFLLRLFGAKIGKGVYVAPSARIWYPPHLILDDFAALGDDVDIYCMSSVRIGKYGIVSKRAHICAGTHDINDPFFQLIAKKIIVGDHAWVAAEAFIGPGVTLGEGAVLGARGVTMRDLKPWTVYAGNPAKEIKTRDVVVRNDFPSRGWLKSKGSSVGGAS